MKTFALAFLLPAMLLASVVRAESDDPKDPEPDDGYGDTCIVDDPYEDTWLPILEFASESPDRFRMVLEGSAGGEVVVEAVGSTRRDGVERAHLLVGGDLHVVRIFFDEVLDDHVFAEGETDGGAVLARTACARAYLAVAAARLARLAPGFEARRVVGGHRRAGGAGMRPALPGGSRLLAWLLARLVATGEGDDGGEAFAAVSRVDLGGRRVLVPCACRD